MTNRRTALTLIFPVVGDEAPSEIPLRRMARLDPRHAPWRAVLTVVVVQALGMGAILGADQWWGPWGDEFRAGIDGGMLRWVVAVLPWILGLWLLVWSSRFLGWVRAWPAHLVFAGLLVAWAVHDEWQVSGYWHYVALLLALALTARGSRRRRVEWARRTSVSRPDHVPTVAHIHDILWTSVKETETQDALLVVASEHAPHGRWFVARRRSAPGVAGVRFAVGDPVVVLYRPTDPAVAILRPVPEQRWSGTGRSVTKRLRSALRLFRDVTGFTTPAEVEGAIVEPQIIVPPRSRADRTVAGPES